jgi:hypothetical protein
MPTILNSDGYRFHFYSSDRDEPPHVHVSKAEGYAKIWLEPTIESQYFYNFKTAEQRKILKIVEENEGFLKEQWYDFFR